MSKRDKRITASPRVSRRTTLQMIGTTLAATPLTAAFGCQPTAEGSSDAAPSSPPPTTAVPSDTRSAPGAASTPAASTPAVSRPATATTPATSMTAPMTGSQTGMASQTSTKAAAGQSASAGQSSSAPAAAGQGGNSAAGAGANTPMQIVGWAMGGTAAITNASAYPSPFGTQMDSSCVRTEPMTLGPCHDNMAPEREDISEGRPGLPVRFGLRVVNAQCQPITGANVDLWHCDAEGIYSSETSDIAPYCTSGKPEAQPARWFRGHRQVDETGTAWFNTCFPGWYPSRALHFHITVRRSSRQGMEALTTQLGFDPKLGDEICTSHPDYKDHGKPDTPNMTDNTFVGSDYIVETKRMPDGVMLVWKTLVIPS